MATQFSEFCTVDVVDDMPNGKGKAIVISKPHGGGFLTIESPEEAYLVAQRLINAAYEFSTRDVRKALIAAMEKLHHVPS